MAEPEFKNADVFSVIGFTREDILNGAQYRTMRLSEDNLKTMMLLRQRFGPLASAAERGLVIKGMVEVYFLDPFAFYDDNTFERRFGSNFQVVEFYNEAAFQLSQNYHIDLPPVIEKVTRMQLPERLGISMRFPCYFLP
ncbi:MAG TPA: hypothetical protein VNJ52_04335 [Patescibacteria group bacterium]|nr:hypothetical protein [Patescibacteria group bacterium]